MLPPLSVSSLTTYTQYENYSYFNDEFIMSVKTQTFGGGYCTLCFPYFLFPHRQFVANPLFVSLQTIKKTIRCLCLHRQLEPQIN